MISILQAPGSNSNLDQIRFLPDTIELCYGFDIPPERFSYRQRGDTLTLGTSNAYGDFDDNFRVYLTYTVVDSNTLIVSSNQLKGFIGRQNPSFTTFRRFETLFREQAWDSLILLKYIPIVYGPTTTLQEKLLISSGGDILLNTILVDTLKHRKYASSLDSMDWLLIRQQISYIDTAQFHLFQSESQDALLLEMHLYRGNEKLTFAGYEFPLIFSELRDFLYFGYRTLPYRPITD